MGALFWDMTKGITGVVNARGVCDKKGVVTVVEKGGWLSYSQAGKGVIKGV